MPPNGPAEWRARIGHWENRKLRWYQAHCGSRPRVPLHLLMGRVISEAPLLCVLLLLLLAWNVVAIVYKGALYSSGKLVGQGRSCTRVRRCGVWVNPFLSLFLALSLLLIVAGDVETNPGPISDELLDQLDDSELTEEDIHNIYSEVIGLSGRWSDMCLALRLPPSDQSEISTAYLGNPEECLQAVLVKWLKKGYNYQKFGSPTWRMLVEAVADPAGGNDSALANFLTQKHQAHSKITSKYYGEKQTQMSESQFSTKHQEHVEDTKVAGHITIQTPSTSNDVSPNQTAELAAEFASVLKLHSSQAEPKTNISTYTTSGWKRAPLTHDFPKVAQCSSEFQHLISEVGMLLGEHVQTNKLKEFLYSLTHVLYPEIHYIDPRLLKGAKSIPQIFKALQPQVMNFLNWGVLRKVVETFSKDAMPAVESYISHFPKHLQVASLPDPILENQILELQGAQKLRVSCSGSGFKWTLGDVQVVKEAVEKATGIDQDFIIYAYWEEGLTTHQFTFFIPKSSSRILGELCKEDLIILAGKGVHRLEVDYDTIVDNLQEIKKREPRTNSIEIKSLIPRNKAEQMNEEDLSHLNKLIAITPASELHKTCSVDFLRMFSKTMTSWKVLVLNLGIKRWDLEDLAEMYPGDEEEQKYRALLDWKRIDVNLATYEKLLKCLLVHGYVEDATKLLQYIYGVEIHKAQKFLQQNFMRDSISKKKLWCGAPRLSRFNRRFGIVKNAQLLSDVDYTCCYEMMNQFSSEIQELSMKSVLNMITHKKWRVYIFKGPPGCGKTEVISRMCDYWARHYALRNFILVLYVNIWDLHRDFSLQDLIERQFKGSTVNNEEICRWITKGKGHRVLFILDGFCREYLYQSQLHSGNVLYHIISGSSNFSKARVVVASTCCSDIVRYLYCKYIKIEVLGLSDEQIGKEIVRHFDSERAADCLSYLTENAEIHALVSSPTYLIAIVYIVTHISYNSLPMTWTQLYISLVVLVIEWHKGELNNDFSTISLQSHFKSVLLKYCSEVVEDPGDVLANIGKLLLDDVEEHDNELPDHNSAVPYLQYFSFALEALLDPDFVLDDDAVLGKESFTYFWYFLAGLGGETNSKKLLNKYYQNDWLKMANCVYENREVTAKQQSDLPSQKAEVIKRVVTTREIHSILHFFPYMHDPHSVIFKKCYIGTQATKELAKFLAAGSSGLWQLCLTGLSGEAFSLIAVALKRNHSLKTLNLEDMSSEAVSELAMALSTNLSLHTLIFTSCEVSNEAATSLAMALKTNRSLQTLNFISCEVSNEAVISLTMALKTNHSLQTLNLACSVIGDTEATALADSLRVNQSLRTLSLHNDSLTSTGVLALAKAMQENKSLEKLDLLWEKYKWTEIGNEGVIALAVVLQRMTTNFKVLNLSKSGLTATGVEALARALHRNTSLKELNLEMNVLGFDGVAALTDALKVNQSLKALNLRNSGLTATGVKALAKAMKKNNSLEELNLGSNVIGSEGFGVAALADTLRVNKSLKALNLECNKIEDGEIIVLAGTLRVNKTLKILNLGKNGLTSNGALALANALQQNTALKELNLESNELGQSGALLLAHALKVNQSLRRLGFGQNAVADEGASSLGHVLSVNKSLKELNLESNKIGDEGATVLGDALRVNRSLEMLNLRNNTIGVKGATALADALKVNSNLGMLDFGQNLIGDEGASAMADVLRVNRSLKALSLLRNKIGDDGATALANALAVNRNLTTLNLQLNVIGDKGATALAFALRKSKYLGTLHLEGNTFSYMGAKALRDANMRQLLII